MADESRDTLEKIHANAATEIADTISQIAEFYTWEILKLSLSTWDQKAAIYALQEVILKSTLDAINEMRKEKEVTNASN